jgi:hypothetical protein
MRADFPWKLKTLINRSNCHSPQGKALTTEIIFNQENISENKSTCQECKMKLLLNLHGAQLAPTEPGCRPT